jgi:chaperonin cofactor prefoldin
MVGGQEEIDRRFADLRVRSETLRRQYTALATTFARLKTEVEASRARFRVAHPVVRPGL